MERERYWKCFDNLTNFERIDFAGPTPYSKSFTVTSVFLKKS
jgi:hypothetical protein